MAKKGGMFESLLGEKKPKAGNPPPPDMGDDEEGYGDVPPVGFEDEAIAAFPDLEGSPERIDAFWRAVKACVGG